MSPLLLVLLPYSILGLQLGAEDGREAANAVEKEDGIDKEVGVGLRMMLPYSTATKRGLRRRFVGLADRGRQILQ